MGIHIHVAGASVGASGLARILSEQLGLRFVDADVRWPSSKSTPIEWFSFLARQLGHVNSSVLDASGATSGVVSVGASDELVEVVAKWLFEERILDDLGYAALTELETSIMLPKIPRLIVFQPGRILGEWTDSQVQRLEDCYSSWLSGPGRVPVVSLADHPWSANANGAGIALDVLRLIQRGVQADGFEQLSLFDDRRSEQVPKSLRIVRRGAGFQPQGGKFVRSPGARLPLRPFVYVAAPFTGVTASAAPSNQLPNMPARSRIPGGPYRRILYRIEGALQTLGLDTVIPHRDVSGWGDRKLSASEIATWCTIQVQYAALVCAIPGSSAGVHYELGLARAWNKPCLIFEKSAGTDSTIGRGITGRNVLRLAYNELADVPDLLSGPAVARFLRDTGVVT